MNSEVATSSIHSSFELHVIESETLDEEILVDEVLLDDNHHVEGESHDEPETFIAAQDESEVHEHGLVKLVVPDAPEEVSTASEPRDAIVILNDVEPTALDAPAGTPMEVTAAAGTDTHDHQLETDESAEIEVPAPGTEPDVPHDSRVLIQIRPGEGRLIRSQVMNALAATGRFFHRAGAIVEVRDDLASGDQTIHQLTAPELALAIDDVTIWDRFDSRSGEWVRSDPPEKLCKQICVSGGVDQLPVLTGIARQPHLRQDGSICTTPGYDPASKLYGAFSASAFPMTREPTVDDAKAALGLLEGLLAEFTFAGESDRSAALAGLLTAASRRSLPTAPMFHVRAHAPGSGKSYLCSVITSLAVPHPGAPLSPPTSNEECEKVLLAELARGAAVITFDNMNRDLVPHPKLCTVLTEEMIAGRILRSSKMINVSTRALILSSGNNVGPIGDMTRRCITINLDARTEAPETRTFERPDLLRHIQEHRGRYVAAALTVIGAWIAAGKPRVDCPPFGSFEHWSDWCRQPLLWLGHEDAAASTHRAYDEDPDRQRLGQLLKAWHTHVGSKPAKVRDLVAWADPFSSSACANPVDLRELLEDIADTNSGGINRKRLGWWLKHHTGWVVEDLRLEHAPRRGNAEAWMVLPK